MLATAGADAAPAGEDAPARAGGVDEGAVQVDLEDGNDHQRNRVEVRHRKIVAPAPDGAKAKSRRGVEQQSSHARFHPVKQTVSKVHKLVTETDIAAQSGFAAGIGRPTRIVDIGSGCSFNCVVLINLIALVAGLTLNVWAVRLFAWCQGITADTYSSLLEPVLVNMSYAAMAPTIHPLYGAFLQFAASRLSESAAASATTMPPWLWCTSQDLQILRANAAAFGALPVDSFVAPDVYARAVLDRMDVQVHPGCADRLATILGPWLAHAGEMLNSGALPCVRDGEEDGAIAGFVAKDQEFCDLCPLEDMAVALDTDGELVEAKTGNRLGSANETWRLANRCAEQIVLQGITGAPVDHETALERALPPLTDQQVADLEALAEEWLRSWGRTAQVLPTKANSNGGGGGKRFSSLSIHERIKLTILMDLTGHSKTAAQTRSSGPKPCLGQWNSETDLPGNDEDAVHAALCFLVLESAFAQAEQCASLAQDLREQARESGPALPLRSLAMGFVARPPTDSFSLDEAAACNAAVEEQLDERTALLRFAKHPEAFCAESGEANGSFIMHAIGNTTKAGPLIILGICVPIACIHLFKGISRAWQGKPVALALLNLLMDTWILSIVGYALLNYRTLLTAQAVSDRSREHWAVLLVTLGNGLSHLHFVLTLRVLQTGFSEWLETPAQRYKMKRSAMQVALYVGLRLAILWACHTDTGLVPIVNLVTVARVCSSKDTTAVPYCSSEGDTTASSLPFFANVAVAALDAALAMSAIAAQRASTRALKELPDAVARRRLLNYRLFTFLWQMMRWTWALCGLIYTAFVPLATCTTAQLGMTVPSSEPRLIGLSLLETGVQTHMTGFLMQLAAFILAWSFMMLHLDGLLGGLVSRVVGAAQQLTVRYRTLEESQPAGHGVFVMQTVLEAAQLSNFVYHSRPRTTDPLGWHAELSPRYMFLGQLFDSATDTHGMVLLRNGRILIAFRGTTSGRNARTDLHLPLVPLEWATKEHDEELAAELVDMYARAAQANARLASVRAGIHVGFLTAFRAVQEQLMRAVLSGLAHGGGAALPVIVTGHSLGGALATCAAVFLADTVAKLRGVVQCVTFGQPRVGNFGFKDYFEHRVACLRVCNRGDPITRSPPSSHPLLRSGFTHSGVEVLVHPTGSIFANPTPIERRIFHGVRGIAQHLMVEYLLALLSFAVRVRG